MTKCYCAWIVAVFAVLPIFWLFDLHFCKVCLHFSYTLFFLFLLAKIPAMPFLVRHACHLWHLIDFKRFFPAMSAAKTCHQCRQNVKSLILKEFLFVKCVMSLSYSTLSLIIILSLKLACRLRPLAACCCLLLGCYYISNATL